MNDELSIPLWGALTALGLLVVLVVLLVVVLADARRDRRRLAARLDAFDLAAPQGAGRGAGQAPEPTPGPPATAPSRDYLITRVGQEPEPAAQEAAPPPVDARLFTDTLLRESVVRSAALVHGVRRALAPEVRHRIRFEVRRGTKQARRRRRSEMKTAHREWQARRRAGLDA